MWELSGRLGSFAATAKLLTTLALFSISEVL